MSGHHRGNTTSLLEPLLQGPRLTQIFNAEPFTSPRPSMPGSAAVSIPNLSTLTLTLWREYLRKLDLGYIVGVTGTFIQVTNEWAVLVI